MKKLGPREYWPVAQAAKQLGSTVDDMVHAAGQRQIQLCINLFQSVEEACCHRIPMPDEGLNEKEQDMGWQDEPLETQIQQAQTEFWGRTRCCMPTGVYELYYDDARRLELSITGSIYMKEAVRFDGKDWWIVEFRQAVEVYPEQLVMRHEELQKFMDQKSNGSAGDLDKREHTAYLNVIGILSHILRNRPGKELSEAALIQLMLTAEMKLRPDPNARPLYGLSERSLQDKLKHARHSMSMAGAQLPQTKNTTATPSV